jgi:hypothetical protein
MPVEERAAKGVLRRADLSAEGGLADADLPRRRGEGAVIGHGQHAGEEGPIEGGRYVSHSVLNGKDAIWVNTCRRE